jgi:hypothetical protein
MHAFIVPLLIKTSCSLCAPPACCAAVLVCPQLQQVAKAKDSIINELMTKLATQAAAAQAAAQRAADHQTQLQASATGGQG